MSTEHFIESSNLLNLILATVILFFAWRVRRTRIRLHYQSNLECKAAQMELTALQSQMNPHFIFNALGLLL